MRYLIMLIVAASTAASAFFALTDATHAKEIARDIVMLVKPTPEAEPYTPILPTELEPGLSVHNSGGDRIGTILALSKRDGVVMQVWTRDQEFLGSQLSVVNGAAIVNESKFVNNGFSSANQGLPK